MDASSSFRLCCECPSRPKTGWRLLPPTIHHASRRERYCRWQTGREGLARAPRCWESHRPRPRAAKALRPQIRLDRRPSMFAPEPENFRSEEHTSELQSRLHLVCRLLLEKKKNIQTHTESNYTT